MTYEFKILVWAAFWGLFMLGLGAFAPYNRKGYFAWNSGPRDEPFDVGPLANRLNRAFRNFMETYVFFVVIVVALALEHRSTPLSLWGARLYLSMRVLYLPLYAMGIRGLRSFVWGFSLAGILMCAYALFF